MPSTSGAQIGGVLEDMRAVMTQLGEAGGASAAHAGDAATGVQALQSEVNDVTAALTRTFAQLADDLRQQITRARETLMAADWSGQSRGAADAAEARLNQDVNATLDAAQAGVDELGVSLRSQVERFYDEVTGQFTAVMQRIEGAYAELARGTQLFAENLAQADQTISFGS